MSSSLQWDRKGSTNFCFYKDIYCGVGAKNFVFAVLIAFLAIVTSRVAGCFIYVGVSLKRAVPIVGGIIRLACVVGPKTTFNLFPRRSILFLKVIVVLLLTFT